MGGEGGWQGLVHMCIYIYICILYYIILYIIYIYVCVHVVCVRKDSVVRMCTCWLASPVRTCKRTAKQEQALNV